MEEMCVGECVAYCFDFVGHFRLGGAGKKMTVKEVMRQEVAGMPKDFNNLLCAYAGVVLHFARNFSIKLAMRH